jgi:hypothetical protein
MKSPDELEFSPLDQSNSGPLLRALGLSDWDVGPHVRRDARGWKTSEETVDRLLIATIRPAFQAELAMAVAVIDDSPRAAVLVGADLIGPVEIDPTNIDLVGRSWPAGEEWMAPGWITLDGFRMDVVLSKSGASTRVRFSAADALGDFSTAILRLIAGVAENSASAVLRGWLAAFEPR